MKLKWIPTNIRGGVSMTPNDQVHQAYFGPQFLYYDIDTYNTGAYTFPRIAAMDKNWQFDPARSWKKYFSAKRLSVAQNVSWQDTATYANATATTLTNASVGFQMEFKGQGEGLVDTFGYIKATWYVTFKG